MLPLLRESRVPNPALTPPPLPPPHYSERRRLGPGPKARTRRSRGERWNHAFEDGEYRDVPTSRASRVTPAGRGARSGGGGRDTGALPEAGGMLTSRLTCACFLIACFGWLTLCDGDLHPSVDQSESMRSIKGNKSRCGIRQQ